MNDNSMTPQEAEYYAQIIKNLESGDSNGVAMLKTLIQNEVKKAVSSVSQEVNTLNRRVADLYKADFPKAINILENAISEDLQADSTKFYCFDAINKNSMYIFNENSQKQYTDIPVVFKEVFNQNASVINGDNAYIPIMNKNDEILGVAVVENGNYIKESVNECQSETSKFFATTIEKENNATEKEYNAKLAVIDSLTKTPNNYALTKAFEGMTTNKTEIFSESMGVGKTFFAMCDIDHFKMFNDTYGHSAGDAVLAEFAKTLTESVQPNGQVYRYGGEEFAVILQDVTKAEALEIMNYARETVDNNKVDITDNNKDSHTVNINVSIGVSALSVKEISALKETKELDRISISELGFLKKADTALDLSKKNGRNQVNYSDIIIEKTKETVAEKPKEVVILNTLKTDVGINNQENSANANESKFPLILNPDLKGKIEPNNEFPAEVQKIEQLAETIEENNKNADER